MIIQQPIPSNLGINLLKQATIALDNDTIIALPTDGVIAVPAPGENLIIICPATQGLGGFYCQMENWVADYSNIATDASFRFYVGDNGANATYGGDNKLANFFGWGAGGVDRAFFQPGVGNALTFGDNLNSIIEFANKPIIFNVLNNDGPFQDGNPGNSMRLTTQYFVYDTNTGLLIS